MIYFFTVLVPSKSHAIHIKFNKLQNLEQFTNKRIRALAQDKQGFIWFATNTDLLRFDGYQLKSYTEIFNFDSRNTIIIKEISKLYVDDDGTLWVISKQGGLFKITNNKITALNQNLKGNSALNLDSISAITGNNENIWLAGKTGLKQLYQDGTTKVYPFPKHLITEKLHITSIIFQSENKILIGTNTHLLSFDIGKNKYEKTILNQTSGSLIVYTIYKDKTNNIWLGTSLGAFLKKSNESKYLRYKPATINFSILSIQESDNDMWFGSILEGLIKVSKSDKSIAIFKHHTGQELSLSDDSNTSLMLDKNGVLWIVGFNGGIDYIDTKVLNFNLESIYDNSMFCGKSSIIYGIDQHDSDVWLSSEDGVINYNHKERQCTFYKDDLVDGSLSTKKISFSSNVDKQNTRWIATSNGLSKIDKQSLVSINKHTYKFKNVFFSFEYEPGILLLGTDSGLFNYNISTDLFSLISAKNTKLNTAKYFNYSKDGSTYYFATNQGLILLNQEKQLILKENIQKLLPTKDISSVYVNQNEVWLGTYLNGLFHFNQEGILIKKYNLTQGLSYNLSISSIQSDNSNNLWLGTDNGLIKLNRNTGLFHTFLKSDGIQNNYFIRSSSHKAPDGKLYFGGKNGFNAFYPEDIKLNTTPPNIVLTEFTRFGKSVEVGVEREGFLLKKDINQLKEIHLTHRDYVIGFEFSALDFADSSRNKYAYMMEGLDKKWIYTDANNRRISYSNLSSGNYTFRVKGSNKDGTWNEEGKSLKIIVKPAPWFSWWAYSLYLLTFFTLLTGYINRKNRANKRITKMLRIEVAKQTQEIKGQKLKVENLLAQKNELFANVSHEFRTPLTLILGPINKLLNTNLPHSSINDLKMVNRNANRLLTMIEQLLQLAKVSSAAKPQFFPLKTKPHVSNIVDSFKPLAQQKRIELLLERNDETAISTTTDALEIILGNLISNAIKYTQTGGKVTVVSKVADNKIQISVNDTGSGLDQQQQKDIFNRFKRLDYHQNIQGIGIGLSVVESLLTVNNGSIDISSEPGKGSKFMVSFDTITLDFDESMEKSGSLLLNQLTHETTETNSVRINQKTSLNRQKESILIIEDNDDMRAHIEDTLQDTYHCLQADRGKTGIALAIKHVPDIIICDVMMPEMDGFQVSRVIRSDTRTSHIPLVLLTALHDRESRIKGWREHVDVYLTKPFDAQELLLQLENILVIRSILKTKAGQNVRAGKSIENSDLPKKDQQFINKLNELVKKNYQKPLYLRQQMASDMAVSERQLQRKLKALIDKNPMDLLREYRLSKAANMLKDGYQVGITSDECGFNSVAYFSQCFKAQFGLSPKVYQTSCKKIDK